MMNSQLAVHAALFAGVMMLSTSGIFGALAQAQPVIIAFYRLLFTAAVLLPFTLLRAESRRELLGLRGRKLWICAAAGFFLAVHYVMWFTSIHYTTVSSSTTIAALQPVFSMIWGGLFLGERLTRKSAVGAAIAIAGTFVIGWGDFRVSGAAFLGDALALLSGAVISLYFFFGQLARRELGTLSYSTVSYLCSVITLAAYAMLSSAPFSGYSAATWQCFLGLALISTIGGQMVFNLLLRRVSATTVTMMILAEPIGTCALAMLFLGEHVSAQLGIGMVIILAGLTLFFGGAKKANA